MSNEIKVVLSDVNKIITKVNWLSSNNYTTTEKNKVANVPIDTNASLANKVDKVTGKSLVSDTAITDLTDGNETTLHKHNATNTPFTPTGNLSSTNVQNALAELDTEKASKTQEAWITATLLNSCVVFGTGRNPQYFKDNMGIVRCKGTGINNSISGAIIVFQLPVGYRPPHILFFPIVQNDVFGRVMIDTGGNVTVYTPTTGHWFSFDSISFKAV